MMNTMKIILAATIVVTYCCAVETSENYLPVEAPSFFADLPSPLTKPKESLQKKEYFDFLSTLYRHDRTKSSLFEDKIKVTSASPAQFRQKRAIIFRPLFVYRQQQIKRTRTKG